MYARSVHSAIVLCTLLVVALLGAVPAAAQSDARCFAETNLCITGPIRAFWDRNGGLRVFGLPITEQHVEAIEGKPTTVQWFERNRIELHPENATPYAVLIGRVGADRLAQQGRDWNAFPKDTGDAGCRVFAETGQAVCGAILSAWKASGIEIDGRAGTTEAESLALFGMPLSGVLTETLSDGRAYQVQWFERARFELHPENAAPYTVLLGLLGSDVHAGNAQPSTPPAPTPPAPSCAPVPSPTNGTISAPCVRGGDKLTLVATGLQPGELVKFRLLTPDKREYEFAIIVGDAATRTDGTYHLVGALQPGVPAGTYTLKIIGRKSDTTSSFPFGIEAGPPTGANESALPTNVGGGSATPTMGRRGKETFTFTTAGVLPAKSQVGIYATRSDGNVFGAPFRVTTDAQGNVPDNLRFTTDTNDPYGIYATTFEVIETGQKVIIYFRIVPE